MHNATSVTYRRDIDGLRAIAVLAVLLFHIGTNFSNGGFIGVDVFFVISGFLITQTIDAEIRGGRFSIAAFYERRARRIFPALFAMCACTALAATVILPADSLIAFGKSLVAASMFVSNLFFIGQADRGSLDNGAPQPLLHTWSLAVEEQFYLLFPLVLMLLQRRAVTRKTTLLWLLAGLSFVLSVVLVRVAPVAAHYLAPARAWELLAGALLAVGAFPQLRSAVGREVLSALGLLAIVASAVAYTTDTPFPGFAALEPTLGALLIIYAGADIDARPTVVARLLGARLPVALGLISYSLYVWHWPIMIMTDLVVGHPLSKIQKVVVIVVSLVIAYLSWRFVERPFRRHRGGSLSRTMVFRLSFSAIAAACSIGIALIVARGLPQRSAGLLARISVGCSPTSVNGGSRPDAGVSRVSGHASERQTERQIACAHQ